MVWYSLLVEGAKYIPSYWVAKYISQFLKDYLIIIKNYYIIYIEKERKIVETTYQEYLVTRPIKFLPEKVLLVAKRF